MYNVKNIILRPFCSDMFVHASGASDRGLKYTIWTLRFRAFIQICGCAIYRVSEVSLLCKTLERECFAVGTSVCLEFPLLHVIRAYVLVSSMTT